MICAILCGGAGSRLWPLSRALHPKPFLRLPEGQSFIQKAFQYAAAMPGVSAVMSLSNRDLFFKAADEYRALGLDLPVFHILEPCGRNTAPAVAVAALEARRLGGDNEPVLVLAADHLITGLENFRAAVEKALELSADGSLVTFGIRPESPETGYGYIRAEGHRVLNFVEKPDRATAERYLAEGGYYWNSGIFCFRAGAMLAEMETHLPGLVEGAEKCLEASSLKKWPDNERLELDETAFRSLPDISIDYAVMEKSRKVAVVPCDIGWSDVGSWTAFCGLGGSDGDGNRIAGNGETRLRDSRGCDVHSEERLVVGLGLSGLLIVDTPDALLVADKNNIQDVKEIYGELKDSGHPAHRHHRTVHRPWGSFTVLGEGQRFQVKRLEIKPGASISLQHHHHRSEHWVVVGGIAEVTCEEEKFLVNTNESTYIKAGRKHMVTNCGLISLVIIEVQSGDYLGEDDIVRFSDNYGRV